MFSSAQLRYFSGCIFSSYVSVLSMYLSFPLSNRIFEVSSVIYTQADIIVLEFLLLEIGPLKGKVKIQKLT